MLTAPATAMRVTVLLAASSSSKAAYLLAPLAAPMRLAVASVAFSPLDAAVLLTPPAAPMHTRQCPVSPRADLE
jgi:hypothetical protein